MTTTRAIKGLRAVAEGKQSPLVYSADGPVSNGPVWVLAGFGAQHRKMGKSLYLRDDVFAEWINKVDSLIQDEQGCSIVELILDDSVDYTDETCQYPIEVVQLVIFAIQIALGELLQAPRRQARRRRRTVLGEAAAAYFAGGLSLADATRTICARSHLMGEGERCCSASTSVDGFGGVLRDEIKTVFSDFPDLEVCVYARADADRHRRSACPGRRDHRARRERGKFARKFQTKAPATPSRWILCWANSPPNCRASTRGR